MPAPSPPTWVIVPVLRSAGKLHELSIEYTPHSASLLEEQVAAALQRLLGPAASPATFWCSFPGPRRSVSRPRDRARGSQARGCWCCLYMAIFRRRSRTARSLPAESAQGDSSPPMSPESSVTIEGVTAVIDSGLARVAVDSPWTGVPSLDVRRISQASATQRAGRAGRTAPGRVIRLYTAEDFHRRPKADLPEVMRRELSQISCASIARHGSCGEDLDVARRSAGRGLACRQRLARSIGSHRPQWRSCPFLRVWRSSGRGQRSRCCRQSLGRGRRAERRRERGSSDLLTLMEADWQPQTRARLRSASPSVPGARSRD